MRLNKISLRTYSGFIISGILLWLTLHSSGLTLNKVVLQGWQWVYFVFAMAMVILSVWIYAIRAKLFWVKKFDNDIEVNAYSSIIIGNFYNCLLPGNLGDGVRAWHFSKKNKVFFTRSLAALVTEKWLDAQMFVLLVLALFIVKPYVNHFITNALVYTAAVVLLLSAVYLLLRNYRTLEKLVWQIIIRLNKKGGFFLYRLYLHNGSNVKHIKKEGFSIYYVVLCLCILMTNILQFFFLLKTAGIEPPVAGFYTSLFTAAAMMIIAIIPSAPGSIGVLHYGIYSALILVAKMNGLAPTPNDLQCFALFGVYLHLSYLIPEMIMGIVIVAYERKLVFG